MPTQLGSWEERLGGKGHVDGSVADYGRAGALSAESFEGERERESTLKGLTASSRMIKVVWSDRNEITRRRHQSRRPSRPCGPSCVGADLTQRRSAARSLQHHTRKLLYVSIQYWKCENQGKHSRFSPVWLYICVCNEDGRVKRLSHTLHLCFFWVLEGILELNWLIMD
jgi:hypothetical protein